MLKGKYGLLRANQHATKGNPHKEPKDWDLPVATDSFSGAASGARSGKGIKYKAGDAAAEMTLAFAALIPFDANTKLALPAAILDVLDPYEFNLRIDALWETNTLTFSHEGQGTITSIVLDDDTELPLARA